MKKKKDKTMEDMRGMLEMLMERTKCKHSERSSRRSNYHDDPSTTLETT